jgi:uncharacterized protein (TIGR02145 family)
MLAKLKKTFVFLPLLLSCADNPTLEFPTEEQVRQRYSSSKTAVSSSSAKPSSSSIAPSSSSTLTPPSSSSMSSSSNFVCTASNNTDTDYCSNGTIKQYGSVTDDGGRTYKTVEIDYPEVYQTLGNFPPQVWMAENINYNVSGSICYGEQETNCDKYGRLYNWATAMKLPLNCNSENCAQQIDAKKHRGICPPNWHIPTKAEWNSLISIVGAGNKGGTNLKATSGWDSYEGQDGNGTDTYGFAALPGGMGNADNEFSFGGDTGYWWGNSGSGGGSYYLLMTNINGYLNIIGTEAGLRSSLFSIRCIKD